MNVSNGLVSILSVVIAGCAVIASVVAMFLARRSETLKLQASLRTSAYVDFIRGIAGLAVAQKDSLRDEESYRELRQLTMLVADAKARSSIYGGARAVSASAQFARGGSALDSPERTRAFAAVCRGFRNDGRPKLEKVSDADMQVLLFGPNTTDSLEARAAS
jgi:hypothetical protein